MPAGTCSRTWTLTACPTALEAVLAGEAALPRSTNFQFRVDVTDAGEPGTNYRYAIQVTSPAFYQLGSPTSQVILSGGNIQVHK